MSTSAGGTNTFATKNIVFWLMFVFFHVVSRCFVGRVKNEVQNVQEFGVWDFCSSHFFFGGGRKHQKKHHRLKVGHVLF